MSPGARILLGGILAIAAATRFVGLTFGEDISRGIAIHPDEVAVAVALRELLEGHVGFFVIAYGGGYFLPLAAFARALAAFGGPNAASAAFFDPVLVARIWSAGLSTLTVAVVFAIGRQLRGVTCGLAAAFLLSASTLAIRDAHLAKADSAAALAAALVLWALARTTPARSRGLAGLAWMGVATGLAVSTKYVVGLLPAVALSVLAMLRHPRASALRTLGVFALAATVSVVCLNYFWITDPARSWADLSRLIRSQAEYVRAPHFAGRTPSPLWYHLTVSLRHGCGLLFALCALPALVHAAWRRGVEARIALALVGQLVVLLANPLAVARNFEPLVPGLCVLVAGLIVVATAGLLGARRGWRLAVALTTLAVGAAPLIDGARLAWVLRQPDTRTLAADWMAANLPPDASVRCSTAPVLLMACPDPKRLRAAPSDRGVRYVVRASYPAPFLEAPEPPGDGAARLVVFDPFPGGEASPVVERLDLFFLPLAQFAGVAHGGPTIEIFRIDPAGPPAS